MTVHCDRSPMVHVRIHGRSYDLPRRVLNLGPLPSDRDIRHAVARYLGIAEARLRDTVVELDRRGDATVRPAPRV